MNTKENAVWCGFSISVMWKKFRVKHSWAKFRVRWPLIQTAENFWMGGDKVIYCRKLRVLQMQKKNGIATCQNLKYKHYINKCLCWNRTIFYMEYNGRVLIALKKMACREVTSSYAFSSPLTRKDQLCPLKRGAVFILHLNN